MSVKVYKANLARVLEILRITPPEHIAMDQLQVADLLRDIKAALETYDPLPTGNATVSDVMLGKTFSNATGLGLVGIYEPVVLSKIPAPVLSLDVDNKRLVISNADELLALLAAIEVYDGETLLGEAALVGGVGWAYDLSALTQPGAYSLNVTFNPADGVSLVDSDPATSDMDIYSYTRDLTGCADSNTDLSVFEGAVVGGTLSLLEDFNTLPVTIDITVGGVPLVAVEDYTYDNATGVYSILTGEVTGTLVLTAVATV